MTLDIRENIHAIRNNNCNSGYSNNTLTRGTHMGPYWITCRYCNGRKEGQILEHLEEMSNL
jgi:hypothetical protein